jgi:hypothetical protein
METLANTQPTSTIILHPSSFIRHPSSVILLFARGAGDTPTGKPAGRLKASAIARSARGSMTA